VDLAGDGALAAAQDVELGQPLLGVPLHRELGGLMAGHVDQGDAPHGMVGVAIPPVEPVTVGPPEEAGSRATPQPSQGGLAAQPPGLSPAVPAAARRCPGHAGPGHSAGAAGLTSLVSSTSRASSSPAGTARAGPGPPGPPCGRLKIARGPGRRARQARASALWSGTWAAGWAMLGGRHRHGRAVGRRRRPAPSSRPGAPPRSTRISSTWPHGSGVVEATPDRVAPAAASASMDAAGLVDDRSHLAVGLGVDPPVTGAVGMAGWPWRSLPPGSDRDGTHLPRRPTAPHRGLAQAPLRSLARPVVPGGLRRLADRSTASHMAGKQSGQTNRPRHTHRIIAVRSLSTTSRPATTVGRRPVQSRSDPGLKNSANPGADLGLQRAWHREVIGLLKYVVAQ
jgi:hypothetical protein